jgi:hypothetical protein
VSHVSMVTPRLRVCRPIGLAPAKVYWSGLNEALSGHHENYLGDVQDIFSDFPFT